MERVIEGYVLRTKYHENESVIKAAVEIEGCRCFGLGVADAKIALDVHSISYKDSIARLSEAGVLNLWFKKVYKELNYTIGNYIKITDMEPRVTGWLDGCKGRIYKIIGPKTGYCDGNYYKVEDAITGKTGGMYREFKLAKDEEVRVAKAKNIVHEAKKRYPIGTRFTDLVNNKGFTVKSHSFDTFGNPEQLYVPVHSETGMTNKTARIYRDGTWAKKVTYPHIHINGYTARFENDCVKFGCKTYPKEFVYMLKDLVDMISVDEKKEQITKIAKHFRNK